MPQGAPCPGILDRMDLKDWPRRQGYSAGCLDGYCQVIFFFYRICTLPFPSLACDTYIPVLLYYIHLIIEFVTGVKYSIF